MNTDPETLETVGKLIAWKRYEQPPPGYFDQLPRKIVARIEIEQIRMSSSLWERILTGVKIKPAFAYAFGVAACGTLILAVGYLSQVEPDPAMLSLPTGGLDWDMAPAQQEVRDAGLTIAPVAGVSSTNPVIVTESLRPLFEGFTLRAEPASYSQ